MFFVYFFCAVCDVCLWVNNMVVASYGQCPRCHERRTAKANALKFLCLLEYEGKVIFFRPVVHITLLLLLFFVNQPFADNCLFFTFSFVRHFCFPQFYFV